MSPSRTRAFLGSVLPSRHDEPAGRATPVVDVGSFLAALAAADPARRGALEQRMAALLAALELPVPAATAERAAAVEAALAAGDPRRTWLGLAVLCAVLPQPFEVERAVRTIRLDGTFAGLDAAGLGAALRSGPARPVQVRQGEVLVDVHLTSRFPLSTGVQRVVRETVRRWHRDHTPTFLEWDVATMSFVALTAGVVTRTLAADVTPDRRVDPDAPVVVPWRSTYVLPEVQADVERAPHLHAMLQFSGNRSGVIGYDCVPLSTAETTIVGMSNGFAAGLAAEAHADRICAISEAAAGEFRGWRTMLAGAGLTGPDVVAVPLPVEIGTPSESELAAVRAALVLGALPLVLVVGSHEPRKNHLAVLHAAELLWREGHRFTLTFVAGRSWHDTDFREAYDALRGAGRPVDTVDDLDDDGLWAAYRLARFTVFPSLNEGFGLPVAESLAAGTPVVTSGFGSMAEIAAGGGAVLVDPRDDHDLAAGMRRLLTDRGEVERLRAEALARPSRTWDDYAAEVWAALVPGADGEAWKDTGAGH